MFDEKHLEEQCLAWFKETGWRCRQGDEVKPGGAGRDDARQVLLTDELRTALIRINPQIPADSIDDAMRAINQHESPILAVNNRRFHQYLTKGIEVSWRINNRDKVDYVRLLDFAKVDNNSFCVVKQMQIKGARNDRRPDIVAFINGIPIAVLELKSPRDEQADIWQALNQIKTYQGDIPDLFVYNVATIISDGHQARIGSLTAGKERYSYWRTLDTEDNKPQFKLQLETMVKGFFHRELLLDYIRYFVIFEEEGGDINKKIAAYHQFHAVRTAVASTLTSMHDQNKHGKCGVVWHTQGSGKSLSMLCYVAKLIQHPEMHNPTFVIVTDRNDLDNQLYSAFSVAQALLGETPKRADNREKLRTMLNVPSGGVIFTTIQKFSPRKDEQKFPQLTERKNVIVISDEAHRSQYGLRAKIKEDGKITYGYAKHLRDALPNAGFIGFTGTPVSLEDRETIAVFGEYVSIYDIQQSQQDRATVPIYYESRLAELQLGKEVSELDAEVDEIMEQLQDNTDREIERQKRKWIALEKLVTSDARMERVAQDIVKHWQDRLDTIKGKAMIVCISREACVKMYDKLIALNPEWAGSKDHSDRLNASDGKVRVMMTGSASDNERLQAHLYSKYDRKRVEKRFKNEDSNLGIIIVRDMWLTGFDVPPAHTMYIDKPMRGANLMQAIARVNRVFKDKPGGMVVDYLGITNELKEALHTYTCSEGKGKPTVDIDEALAILQGKINYARDLLNGVDYTCFRNQNKILAIVAEACEHILKNDNRKIFCNVVLEITKAHALCSTMPQVDELRDEIAFLQHIKAVLIKGEKTDKKISDDKVQSALRQIIYGSLISNAIVDIYAVAGLAKPDISNLSDDFLQEIKNMKHKNLAVDILAGLLRGEFKSKTATNVVQAKKYSELLAQALNRYRNRAIEAAQVIEELIAMAKDFKQNMARGDKLDLSNDELAFYDALAKNESAVRELGDETLKNVALELTAQLRRDVSIDWAEREGVRARIRLKIKKLLKKYKYPPDKRDDAIKLVLKQAEVLSSEWVKEN